jgi:hypothetical protein
MALKALIQDIGDIPEALKDFYKKTDDGYLLDVDNADYQQKIGEFRNNNIRFKQERDDLKKKLQNYNGVDPVKYTEMRQQLDELNEKGLLESGKIDELVEKRAQKFRQEYEDQIAKLTESQQSAENQAKTYKTQLDELAIGDMITKAVSNVGRIQKGALIDILARAKSVWKINDNGVPVAMDGETLLYGKDGKAPLTGEEWAQQLREGAPYLFEGNVGGGAPGSGGDAGADGVKLVPVSQVANHIDDIATGKAKIIEG